MIHHHTSLFTTRISSLDADLGHIGTSADGAAAEPEVLEDEEEGGAEGGEQEPQEDDAALDLATPLLVVRGAERDVARIFAVLRDAFGMSVGEGEENQRLH